MGIPASRIYIFMASHFGRLGYIPILPPQDPCHKVMAEFMRRNRPRREAGFFDPIGDRSPHSPGPDSLDLLPGAGIMSREDWQGAERLPALPVKLRPGREVKPDRVERPG